MIDIMRFLRDEYPHVFERTRYTIIEISEQLARRQRERAREEGFLVEDGTSTNGNGHGKRQGMGKGKKREEKGGKVEVINKDFFDWEGNVKESCYFIALEVFVSLVKED